MPSMIDKVRTVDGLADVWGSVSALLARLSDDQWALPSPLAGWDVHANVAHMIGTEAMLLGEPAPEVEIDRDVHSHVRNDIGVFNEVWVASMRSMSPADMLARFDSITQQRLGILRDMSQAEWDAESFTPAGKDTYGRFMQIRAFDCWLHEQDIRDAVGMPGHESGPAVEVMLDELTTALGFLVGKKAGAQPGDSVAFILTGESGAIVREIDVEVAERAAVVDHLGQPPTVTLTMPLGVMTRRCAGRVAPEALLDDVHVDGDADLAERILRNQSYTI